MRPLIRRKRSLLYQYLLSYTCIVLIVFALMSVGLMSAAAVINNNQTNAVLENMLDRVTHDIDAQISTMESAALDIAVSSIYHPSSLNRNAYYESIMVESLADFAARCPLTDEYFLLYTRRPGVFFPSAKNTEQLYFAQRLGLPNGAEIADALRSITAFTVSRYQDAQLTLFSLPIRPMGTSNEDERLVLTFVIRDLAWSSRMELLGMTNSGTLSLYYCGELIFGEEQNDKELLCAGNQTDGFFVTLIPFGSGYNSFLLTLFKYVSPILISILVVTLGVGWLSAYRQYRPISKTLRRYAVSRGAKNELINLCQSFDYYIQLNENNMLKLNDQLALLRKQTILSLVCGEYSGAINDIVAVTKIDLGAQSLCAFAIKSEDNILAARSVPDDASDFAGCPVYSGLPYCDGCIPLIVCATSEQARIDAANSLIEHCRATDPNVRIGVGRSVDHLSRLPLSFQEAISAISDAQNPGIIYFENLIDQKSPFLSNNQHIEKIISALYSMDTVSAMQHMEQFFQDVKDSGGSILLKRHLCVCLLNEIMLVIHEMRIPISTEHLHSFLYVNLDEYEKQSSDLLQALCDEILNQRMKLQTDNTPEIVMYVDSNCLQYDINLDGVAERFSISPTRLSKNFKQQTGLSFKEYIVAQRILAAKSMLINHSYSISDICQRVGYSNTSHFIKTFKSIVGVTPSLYRRMHQ